MSMHTLVLHGSDGAVDLYANATPQIPAGETLYIQNISNTDVKLGVDSELADYFLIGGKDLRPEISKIKLSNEQNVFVLSTKNKATLTIQVGGEINHSIGGSNDSGVSASSLVNGGSSEITNNGRTLTLNTDDGDLVVDLSPIFQGVLVGSDDQNSEVNIPDAQNLWDNI